MGQEFDGALDADASMRADTFHGGQADHLRAKEKEVARAAFAGVDGELGHGLAEELVHWFALHFVGDVQGEHVDDATGIARHVARGFGWLWQFLRVVPHGLS